MSSMSSKTDSAPSNGLSLSVLEKLSSSINQRSLYLHRLPSVINIRGTIRTCSPMHAFVLLLLVEVQCDGLRAHTDVAI